jgi:hypothetical protein
MQRRRNTSGGAQALIPKAFMISRQSSSAEVPASQRRAGEEFRQTLSLRICGIRVQIDCREPLLHDLLVANFGCLRQDTAGSCHLHYRAGRRGRGFVITRQGSELQAANDGEFLFLLEKDLTIELQKLRRELYFIHAAALTLGGKAFLLLAPSGHGKSTTCWGLLHHGFSYLSDELAPVNLETLEIEPYAHALCLKDEPPACYPLPPGALRTQTTVHVPGALLPLSAGAARLTALFFLTYRREAAAPEICSISRGEAATRLFAQALNPLAHAHDGLDGAVAIAAEVPSFYVTSAELGLTCELIKHTLQRPVSA